MTFDQWNRIMPELSSQIRTVDYLCVEIPAVPEQVGRARHAVGEFIRRQAWAVEDSDALLLALGEACTNAVRHGGQSSTVCVSCRRLDSHRLQVEVQNTGVQFEPDLHVLSRLPEDIYAMQGRGFGLMLALVDTVQVLSTGETTTVRLTKSKTA